MTANRLTDVEGAPWANLPRSPTEPVSFSVDLEPIAVVTCVRVEDDPDRAW